MRVRHLMIVLGIALVAELAFLPLGLDAVWLAGPTAIIFGLHLVMLRPLADVPLRDVEVRREPAIHVASTMAVLSIAIVLLDVAALAPGPVSRMISSSSAYYSDWELFIRSGKPAAVGNVACIGYLIVAANIVGWRRPTLQLAYATGDVPEISPAHRGGVADHSIAIGCTVVVLGFAAIAMRCAVLIRPL